jgi:hypothetical protein
MEGVLVLVVFVAFALLVWLIGVTADEKSFDEKFPPITDAEFVARCSPGTTPAVALKVRRIIADQLAVEYDRIHPSMSFVEDLGAD